MLASGLGLLIEGITTVVHTHTQSNTHRLWRELGHRCGEIEAAMFRCNQIISLILHLCCPGVLYST